MAVKKEVEMICVSDMEGFSWDLYEKSKKRLAGYLQKFGWELGDCIREEDGKVYSCKAAAIWFLHPDVDPSDWD